MLLVGTFALAWCAAATSAQAQITISLDNASPTLTARGFGAADLLEAVSPPPDVIEFGVSGLGLNSPAGGSAEVTAISFGFDGRFRPQFPTVWYFTVDRNAVGATPPPGTWWPTVNSQAAAGLAASTIFSSPSLWTYPPEGSSGFLHGKTVLDGGEIDDLLLSDPTHDRIDALEIGPGAPSYPIYFTLDAATAVANGATAGDVLLTSARGGTPSVYATAGNLGLSPGDVVDALALWENGQAGFQASSALFDWLTPDTDMLLFSLAPGSPTLGSLDAVLGQPIEVGDILVSTSDGLAILVRAEDLGLLTVRGGSLVGDNLGDIDLELLPEPTSMSLLALGLAGLLRRRRR